MARAKAANRWANCFRTIVVDLPVSGVDLTQGRRPPAARKVGLRKGGTHRAVESL